MRYCVNDRMKLISSIGFCSALMLAACGSGSPAPVVSAEQVNEPLDCTNSKFSFVNLSAEEVGPPLAAGGARPANWVVNPSFPDSGVRSTPHGQTGFPTALLGHGERLFTANDVGSSEFDFDYAGDGYFVKLLAQDADSRWLSDLVSGCPFTMTADLGGYSDQPTSPVRVKLKIVGRGTSIRAPLVRLWELKLPDGALRQSPTGWTTLSISGIVPSWPGRLGIGSASLSIYFTKRENDPTNAGFIDNIRFTYPATARQSE